LGKILPLTDVVVEDVKAQIWGQGKWAAASSPVQMGKQHLYYLLKRDGLRLHLREGHETCALRQQYGLTKTKQKDKRAFNSHCVDAWALAASVSSATKPTEKRLWYVTEIRLHRRQLHRLQPEAGSVRKPYGGTRSLGVKRGTLVDHPKYGLCSVGGNLKGKISLHGYADNKRLTQGANVEHCKVLISSPYRAVLG
jgi:hypothetical protein